LLVKLRVLHSLLDDLFAVELHFVNTLLELIVEVDIFLLNHQLLFKNGLWLSLLIGEGLGQQVVPQLVVAEEFLVLDASFALLDLVLLALGLVSHVAARDGLLKLVEALVDLPLLGQDVLDLLHQHVATVCQVFDPRLGHLHISLDLDVVLFEVSGNFLLLKEQLFVLVALLLALGLLLL
jgi:hypothetical protein